MTTVNRAIAEDFLRHDWTDDGRCADCGHVRSNHPLLRLKPRTAENNLVAVMTAQEPDLFGDIVDRMDVFLAARVGRHWPMFVRASRDRTTRSPAT